MRQEEPGVGGPIGSLDWRKILPFEAEKEPSTGREPEIIESPGVGNHRLLTPGQAASNAPQAPRITFFGHGARHLEGSGLSQAAVESGIEGAVRAAPNAGTHWGWVQVNGQWIQYRAFVLPDGTINIGTYVRVAGNLSNARVP
jgi:hypothetical protein